MDLLIGLLFDSAVTVLAIAMWVKLAFMAEALEVAVEAIGDLVELSATVVGSTAWAAVVVGFFKGKDEHDKYDMILEEVET